MKKVYHRYEKWEDYANGMFVLICEDEEEKLRKCHDLLSSPTLLEKYMRITSTKWVYSAELNMTNRNRNRQAWLGQSACCLYCGAPEYITKQAWRNLTDEQRTIANGVADKIINEWEENYEKRTW